MRNSWPLSRIILLLQYDNNSSNDITIVVLLVAIVIIMQTQNYIAPKLRKKEKQTGMVLAPRMTLTNGDSFLNLSLSLCPSLVSLICVCISPFTQGVGETPHPGNPGVRLPPPGRGWSTASPPSRSPGAQFTLFF